MIVLRWKTPLVLGVAFSSLFMAGCSQTTHSMSVASLADSITPSFLTKARPYRYSGRDRECMERVMFFESNRSSREGMVAVGTVVMNRLRSGKYGDSICAVVGARGQFAPGVMTRKMNSKAMPDVQEAAEAVLKGERAPKLQSAMHFHTAGLKFPYKNMHYVAVAGGNAFYEKRGRNWQPLPAETMVAYGGSTPDAAPQVMVASAENAPAAESADLPGVKQAETLDASPVAVASAEPVAQPAAKPPVLTTAKAARQPAAKPAGLPENSPFALASADPGLEEGFDTAEPAALSSQPAPKKRNRVAAPAVYEVASAEEPAKPARKKKLIDPDAAPLPTARASMMKVVAAKPAAKAARAAAVEMASDEPLAARFGRDDGGASLSFDGQ